MTHGTRILAILFGSLVAAAGVARDQPPPEAGLLEFLGSWSGDESDADFFDFLASLPDVDSEAAAGGADDEQAADHAAP